MMNFSSKLENILSEEEIATISEPVKNKLECQFSTLIHRINALQEENSQFTTALDPPGAPGSPQSVETSVDSITLSWQKPRDDGGSPVTGYILEKRDKGKDRWVQACQTTIADQTFRVTGLKENHEYEFRVAAVNAAGQGPFSFCSDGIFARPPSCPPKIDAAFAMRDITVLAGEEFTTRVPFNAFPVPSATWTINGKTVAKTDRVYSEVNVAFTVLINKKARRDDSGNYTLVLKNNLGSDNGSCRVLVVDKPGPPEGPLEASDITPETCSLSWKPPKDDGGSAITNYLVEKQDANSSVWTKLSSYVRGCHYEVMGLEHKKKYHFRVRAENKYGVGAALDTDRLITAKFSFDPPGPPSTPTITDYDGVSVRLSWDHPVHDGGSMIQGYQVEYCDMADGRWRVGKDYLVKETHFTVPNLSENHDYQFRIKAKNAAGLGEASEPTATFRLKKKFTLPGTPPVVLFKTAGTDDLVTLRLDSERNPNGGLEDKAGTSAKNKRENEGCSEEGEPPEKRSKDSLKSDESSDSEDDSSESPDMNSTLNAFHEDSTSENNSFDSNDSNHENYYKNDYPEEIEDESEQGEEVEEEESSESSQSPKDEEN